MPNEPNNINPNTTSDDGLDLDIDLSGVEEVYEEERTADEIDKETGANENDLENNQIPTAGDDEAPEDDKTKKKKLKKKTTRVWIDGKAPFPPVQDEYDNFFSQNDNGEQPAYDQNYQNVEHEIARQQEIAGPEQTYGTPQQIQGNIPPATPYPDNTVPIQQTENPANAPAQIPAGITPEKTQEATAEHVVNPVPVSAYSPTSAENPQSPDGSSFNPPEKDIGHVNEVDTHDGGFINDGAKLPFASVDTIEHLSKEQIEELSSVIQQSGAVPDFAKLTPDGKAFITNDGTTHPVSELLSASAAFGTANNVSNGAGSFGGGFTSYGGNTPYNGANTEVKQTDSSSIKIGIGNELENGYNGHHFDHAVNPKDVAINDLYNHVKYSELPDATYMGANVLPTPPNSTVNTYKETRQPAGGSLSPSVTDPKSIGHLNEFENHATLGSTDNSSLYRRNENGQLTDTKVPENNAPISSSIGSPLSHGNTQAPTGNIPAPTHGNIPASAAAVAAGAYINNQNFNLSQYDKIAPHQQGTGTPHISNGGIENIATKDSKSPWSTGNSFVSTGNTFVEKNDAHAHGVSEGTRPQEGSITRPQESSSTPSEKSTPSDKSGSPSTIHDESGGQIKESVGSTIIDKKNKSDDIKKKFSAGGGGPKDPETSSPNKKETDEEKKIGRKLEKETALKYSDKSHAIDSLESPGRAAVAPIKDAFKDDKDDDKSTSDQKHDLGTVKTVAKDMIGIYEGVTGLMGLDSCHDLADMHARKIGKATKKFAETGIPVSTLMGDKETLKSALDTAVEEKKISKSERRAILKNREYIHDNLVTQSAIEDAWKKQKGGITAEQAKILKDGDIFDNRFSDKYEAAMRSYFRNSDNPVFKQLSTVGKKGKDIMSMSIGDLKRFYKDNEKNLSPTDKAMLRKRMKDLKGIQARPPKHRIRRKLQQLCEDFKKHPIKTLGRPLSKIMDYATRIQDPTFQAIGKVRHYVNTGLAVMPILSVWGSIAKKPLGFVGNAGKNLIGRTPIGKKIGHDIQMIKDTKKSFIEGTKQTIKDTAKSAARNTIGKASKKVIGNIKSTAIYQKGEAGVKAVSNGIATVKKDIGATKSAIASTKFGKAASKAGKATKTAAKVAAKPVKAVNALSQAIKNIVGKIKKFLYIFIAIFILAYLLILILGSFIAVLIRGGSSFIELESNTILVEPEDIKGWIDRLAEQDKEKCKEALEVAMGPPQTMDVYYGEKIYHYGSPKSTEVEEMQEAKMYHNPIADAETTNGYHIYYLDSEGRTLGQDTTNIKDIISLSTVMVSNDFYDAKTGELCEEEFNALLDKWYELLNPEVFYIESDIYHTEFSTDRFLYDGQTDEGKAYYCTDEEFYTKYQEAVDAGVEFYEEPAEQTEHGCQFDVDKYEIDCQNWRDREPKFTDYWDEDAAEYIDPDQVQEAQEYAQELWSDSWDAWVEEMPKTDDYWYCPGHFSMYYDERYVDPETGLTPGLKCSFGYRDINIYVTVLNKDDVFDAVNDGSNIIKYKVPKNYECTEWEEKQVDITIPATKPESAYESVTRQFYESDGFKKDDREEPSLSEMYQGASIKFDNTDWVNSIFDQDWYGAYGFDVYTNSVSLANGYGVLSPMQVTEIMSELDTSERRSAFVELALQAVGRIPYYWGGKPEAKGYEGNNFGSKVKADTKGRTQKGLDCSGFVCWLYWTEFDIKPASSTKSFTDSLHLKRISFDELQPGDFGMQSLPGAEVNHIGVFVKFDEETGRALWVHENASDCNVSINNTNAFSYYYRFE